MKKTIVISAIALQSGGTLSILQDCLKELSRPEYAEFTIYVILKNKKLAGSDFPSLNFIEVDGTRSYLHRWFYEYFFFKSLSRKLNADLWFSLHDITPNVVARRRAVYCHNPSPFYHISFREFFIDPKFGLFTWLYWILYKINVHKNDFVVVQQQWLRHAFSDKFSVAPQKIVVAYPDDESIASPEKRAKTPVRKFFYPAFPRVFKNFELIGEAVKILKKKGIRNFEVILTLRGTENRYAKLIHRKFKGSPEIRWVGLVSRSVVFDIYRECDYLIFPSRLETWGLPISEFKQTGKPMLISDLPYARETGGGYQPIIFFDPVDAVQLASKMECLITGQTVAYDPNYVTTPAQPAADSWTGLFKILLEN